MQYVVVDLEWNGSYSKKAHGYFNEIIELGAVKLDDDFRRMDTFQCTIRPSVSKKLSGIVTDLTHITEEDLEDGTTFAKMMRRFAAWIGEAPTAVLTWSTTDLLVMMENCRFFYGRQEIPFLRYYMDFQAYAQQRMQITDGQQLGLAKAGEMLGIPEDGMSLHRALDDSLLTAQILQKVAQPESFAAAIQPVDEEFYRRITFKTTIISDIDNPLVKRSELCFSCPACGQDLHRKGKWRFHSRAFCAEFFCRRCDTKYFGRVQFRLKYEGVEVRKRLNEKQESPAPEATDTAG
ncbi:MAG: exonuclease domain-containing protein [Ruminococcaceae bacterium]|nr:exonuclease domain-containing protein [Oscillospiraceae bacterium]